MITVITFVNNERRDTAEADTPEAAITAARTLLAEASLIGGVPVHLAPRSLLVRFFVDGRMVREVHKV